MVAAIKAVAVCPEGNELLPDPSGRGCLTEYFNVLTKPAINAAEKTLETNMRPQELRPGTPASFKP